MRGPIIGSPAAMRMQPPLNPPDYDEGPECEKCGSAMREVCNRFGSSRKGSWYEYHYVCDCCGYEKKGSDVSINEDY